MKRGGLPEKHLWTHHHRFARIYIFFKPPQVCKNIHFFKPPHRWDNYCTKTWPKSYIKKRIKNNTNDSINFVAIMI